MKRNQFFIIIGVIFIFFVLEICVIMRFCKKEPKIAYDEYKKITWVVESWRGEWTPYNGRFSFTIDKIEDGKIEGRYLYPEPWFGWYNDYRDMPYFTGEIKGNEAECDLFCTGENELPESVGTLKLTFLENNRMKAIIDKEGEPHQNYIFRPYNIADVADFWVSEEVPPRTETVDTWGSVNVVVGIHKTNKPHPAIYFTNASDDILYQFDSSYQSGSAVYSVEIEDFNQDGLQDVKIITYFPGDLKIEKIGRCFYQTTKGEFIESR